MKTFKGTSRSMSDPRIDKTRFIAGAVCPSCDALDRIVVETVAATGDTAELSRRRCVACGFADEFAHATPRPSGGVPKGRPERTGADVASSTPVRIIDPDVEGPH